MAKKNESDEKKDTTEETKPQDQAAASSEETKPAEEKPDSRKVKIQRVGDEPATCIPYEDGSGQMKHFRPDAAVNEFEVSAIIAFAAIESGYFEQAPDSKTKSKATSEVK
jgi:hypothetical protein